MSGDTNARVHLSLTLGQAQSVAAACDLYSRLCIGQLDEVAELVRMGIIPMARMATHRGGERQEASPEICADIEMLMNQAKARLDYPRNGSHGIGHPDNAISGNRSYEIKKVLDKALAEHQTPHPRWRGVAYDGLTVRYTQDSAPEASIHTAPHSTPNETM